MKSWHLVYTVCLPDSMAPTMNANIIRAATLKYACMHGLTSARFADGEHSSSSSHVALET